MNSRLNLLVPLAPLFASLLAGCFGKDSCEDFKEGTYMQTVELTPEEYEQWLMGMPPGGSSGGVSTSTSGGDTGTASNFSSTGDPGGTAGGEGGGSTNAGESNSAGGDTGLGEPTSGGATATTGDATTGDDPTTGSAVMLTDQEICMMVCVAASGSGEVESCTIGAKNANGNIPVECVLPTYCEGRRHACVRSKGSAAGHDAAAAWLARAAHDEAASVHAFLALAEELAAHGAPAELLARIETAVDDERRHAALVTDLAQRHGAEIPTVSIAATPNRGLLALAVENMVEGCVRETWAALSAAHQARHAHTPELRDLYASIAADETNHAELAWAINAWLFEQLSDGGRNMVAAARRQAVRQLHSSLAALGDEPELLALGVPGRHDALHLAAGLDATLWSQAA